MALIGEQLEFGSPGALSFLPPDPSNLLFFSGSRSLDLRLDLIKQDATGKKSIKRLRTLLLALDPNTGGPVMKNDARGYLVDILAARSRRANKLLFQVLLADA
jgi:hypothetical protein